VTQPLSDPLARLFLAQQQQRSNAAALQVITGYLSVWAPAAVPPNDRNVVTFSGTRTFRNCRYLGPSDGIAVGSVLLLLTPGAPIILGNLTKP